MSVAHVEEMTGEQLAEEYEDRLGYTRGALQAALYQLEHSPDLEIEDLIAEIKVVMDATRGDQKTPVKRYMANIGVPS